MASTSNFKDKMKPKEWDIMGKITLLTLEVSDKDVNRLPHELFELKDLEALDLRNNKNIILSNDLSKLTNLKLLCLYNCNLDTVPTPVMKLPQLQTLILGNLTNRSIILPDEMSGLVNLMVLRLEKCNMDALPPVALKLLKLQELDLSYNKHISLPDDLCILKNIKVLRLCNCNLDTVPPTVLKLPQLEELDLSYNSGIHLPDELSELNNIRVIKLAHIDRATVPPVVCRLTQLEWLDLSYNPLQTLPPEVEQLTDLKHLDLSHCEMRTLPPVVWRLIQLEWLDMSWNPLQTLPAEEGQLTNIRHLNLSHCRLGTLPPEMGKMALLEWLNLRRNPLQTLSAEVGQLTNVKHLDLSHCHLRTLPHEVGRLKQLERLDLSSDPLETLLTEIGQLTNIKSLILRKCWLRTLPPEVWRLTQIEWLDLSFNHLQTLPEEVGLFNLCDLDVEGNPLIQPPDEVCSQGITAIRQYFDALESSDQDVSARLKVVVLGETMSGKTSLVQTLRSGESSLTRYEDRTHGVEITQWAPDEITFEVHDFGGHDVYHLTHQFFLTQGALNLLTVNLETYRCTEESYTEAVGFWLDTLNARVPGAVVTIVGSKTDRIHSKEREKKARDIQKRFARQQHTWQRSIQQQTDNLQDTIGASRETEREDLRQQLERTRQLLARSLRLTGVYCVSSAEPTSGLDSLRGHILETANNTELFPTLRIILPQAWVDFEQRLRDLRNKGTEENQSAESTSNDDPQIGRVQSNKSKWLTLIECFQQGHLAGLTADRLMPVLSYLQQVGTILMYSDIPELMDMVFHDPSGLIDVIKELFHHDLRKVFTNTNPRLKGFSNTRLKKIRQKLSRKGFLPREVVIAFLGPHATPVGNVEVITNLMEHFGLCYTERSDARSGEASTPTGYYIPWYIREERPRAVERSFRKGQKKGFTVTCEITGFCPRGLFERLSVVVNKLITSRNDWKDLILAVRNSLPVAVYRETKEQHVNIVVKLTVPAEAVQGTQVIWDVIDPLKDKLTTLLKEWPGLLYHLVYSVLTQQVEQEEDQQTLATSPIIPTFEVGPEGCNVEHGGVALEFPQDCVNETRFISVEVESVPVNDDIRTNFTAMSAALTVEQDFPQQFLRPVTVRLPWVWTQPAVGKETTQVVLHYSRGEGWTVFQTDTRHEDGFVIFQTDHFQGYWVLKVMRNRGKAIVSWAQQKWKDYIKDKAYVIVTPVVTERLVHLICMHKSDDLPDLFQSPDVRFNSQTKRRVTLRRDQRVEATFSQHEDVCADRRDLPEGEAIVLSPEPPTTRSLRLQVKGSVAITKEVYDGKVEFAIRGTSHLTGAGGGKQFEAFVQLQQRQQVATTGILVRGTEHADLVEGDENTGLRKRTPSHQHREARPEPTEPFPPRTRRHLPVSPIFLAIAMIAVVAAAYQFYLAGHITSLFEPSGAEKDAPWNDTSKPQTDSWLPVALQMNLWWPLPTVVGLFVAIFGIWFSIFRRGSKVPKVLLLNDEYGTSKGGVSTINGQLGQILTKAKAVVYVTALRVPKQDQETADKDGVQLIGPDLRGKTTEPTLDWLTFYHSVHYPNLPQDDTCIIGHADITDTAARNIWEQRYPQADLMTFNHVLPEDTEYYKGGRKAMEAWEKEKDMLDKSDNAKVTFSVGKRIYDHFDTMYKGAKKPQNHHIFLPKPSEIFLAATVRPGGQQKVVLSIGRVRKVEKLKGHDLVAQSMRDVVKVIKNVRLRVRGISEDDWETSLKILEDNLNSPDLNPTLLPYGTQEDIRDDMMTAHLVLMPSRSEPFGLVGLEAIAAGIPVLISDKTGLAGMILDLIEQGKLSAEHRHVIVETSVNDFDRAGDAKRWADRIVDILNHTHSEFEKAARLKRELEESRYWEESHRTFLQACGIPAGDADL